MNSVSSNAVRKNTQDYIVTAYTTSSGIQNPLTFVDSHMHSIAQTLLGGFKFRIIGVHTSGTPYGNDADTDFIYTAYYLPENNAFCRIVALDIRSNRMFMIAKVAGIWGKWSSYVNLQVDSAILPSAQVGAIRQLNVVQFSIDAAHGSAGLAPNTATKIGTISPAPFLGIVDCIISMDLLSPTDNVFQRCWVTNAGEIFVYHNQANFVNNVFITGTYICAV